ncbi:MAG TPA: CaiB/BaiF CoA-transferase family protein [Vicinamibacteria bacterium]|nr:CaiB/BaiF CoA-transferase family protein [Vicinamibacteria bacterium]
MAKPLEGVRVLEMGQLMAGPFAGTILAYYGAEVIKIEAPLTGDPVRTWRGVDRDGTSTWWRSLGRNKKCITVDLRTDEGRALARELAWKCDVVVENFKPGTMEKWKLGPEDIKAKNPDVIYCRVSGYGQTGPYSHKPGYASVCEGVGGFRYVNGFPDRPPCRPNLSLGDSLAGLHAALGIVMALYNRSGRKGREGGGAGQEIDVAIYESVFNMMEAVVPEFDRLGMMREREGSKLTGIVPTNTYRCKDGLYVIIGGNGDSIYKRLMLAAGREDMANSPEYATNADRVRNEPAVDGAISEWTATLSAAEVVEKLEAAQVPVGSIYTVKDMVNDPHYQARGMFEEVEVGGRPLKIPAMTPKLSGTPGGTEWPGPEVGSHSVEVLKSILGRTDAQIEALKANGTI